MKNNRPYIFTLLVGLLAGGALTAWYLQKEAANQPEKTAGQPEEKAEMADAPQISMVFAPAIDADPIPIGDAAGAYQAYHSDSNPLKLRTSEGDVIQMYYIDEATLITKLRSNAETLYPNSFSGYAMMPVLTDDGYTFVWMAVVNSGTEKLLVIPAEANRTKPDAWTNFIYDYIDFCPKLCPSETETLTNFLSNYP